MAALRPASGWSARRATSSPASSYTEIMAGRGTPNGGVLIDISHLGAEAVERQLRRHGARCTRQIGWTSPRGPVEVSPTAHFHMGGVVIDRDCRTRRRRPARGRRGRRRRARRQPPRRQRRRRVDRLRRARRRHGRGAGPRAPAARRRPRRSCAASAARRSPRWSATGSASVPGHRRAEGSDVGGLRRRARPRRAGAAHATASTSWPRRPAAAVGARRRGGQPRLAGGARPREPAHRRARDRGLGAGARGVARRALPLGLPRARRRALAALRRGALRRRRRRAARVAAGRARRAPGRREARTRDRRPGDLRARAGRRGRRGGRRSAWSWCVRAGDRRRPVPARGLAGRLLRCPEQRAEAQPLGVLPAPHLRASRSSRSFACTLDVGVWTFSASLFDELHELYGSAPLRVFECGLLLAILFHTFNGLRIVAIDAADLGPGAARRLLGGVLAPTACWARPARWSSSPRWCHELRPRRTARPRRPRVRPAAPPIAYLVVRLTGACSRSSSSATSRSPTSSPTWRTPAAPSSGGAGRRRSGSVGLPDARAPRSLTAAPAPGSCRRLHARPEAAAGGAG